MARRPASYDLILAADVLIYFGDLAPFFAAVSQLLRPEGLFAFSIEHHPHPGYTLRPSGRYAHALDYVGEQAARAGLEQLSAADAVLRLEHGQPVDGHIVVLRKPGAASAGTS
jgi:predicted TPR repeat methyltransferase